MRFDNPLLSARCLEVQTEKAGKLTMTELLKGWAKLSRAEESITSLEHEASAFFASEPPLFKVVGEHKACWSSESAACVVSLLAFGRLSSRRGSTHSGPPI
jgi:hypothetical protein